MKKKSLCNRVGSSVLAILLILSLCVSPLMSFTSSAADDNPSTEEGVPKIAIEVLENELECKDVDFNNAYSSTPAIPFQLYAYIDDQKIEADVDAYSWYRIMYYDAEGNLLEKIPSEGTYTVQAKLNEGSKVYIGDTSYILGEELVSEKFCVTLTKEEPLKIVVKDDVSLEFTASEEPVDLSGYFTFNYRGEEPQLLFKGYRKEDGSWDHYDNYSDLYYPDYAAWGYRPFKEVLEMQYYDADGKELDAAPSEPGNYKVKASIPYITDQNGLYAIYLRWEDVADEHYYYYEGAESELIDFTIKEELPSVNVKPLNDEIECPEVDFNNAYSSDPVMPASCFKLCVDVKGQEIEAKSKTEYEFTYYDAEGNQLEKAPWKAGTYTVRATLPEGTEITYGDKDYTLEEAVSGEFTLTLVKTPLEIVLKDGASLEFAATGESVDLSEYFTFRFKGEEPILIFKGFRTDDGYWRDDYENFSDFYVEYEGYLPYKDLLELQYYDANGNELEEAPSEPGNYSVIASIPDLTADNGMYAPYLKYSEDDNGELEDEHYFYREGAESEIVNFTIKATSSETPSNENDNSTVSDNKKDSKATDAKETSSVKTGDNSSIALYLVSIIVCGLAVIVVMVKKRRGNFR